LSFQNPLAGQQASSPQHIKQEVQDGKCRTEEFREAG